VKILKMITSNIAKQGHVWQCKGRHELYLFLFKKLMLFFKRLIPNGISQYNMHLSILNGHGLHITIEIIEHA
jgi:hypothetical protein